MPKFRDRTCISCGEIQYNTATRSDICIKCDAARRADIQIQKDRMILEQLGYISPHVTGINIHNKREWTFTHVCGREQTWVMTNILKRIKADPQTIPCSACGGKRRAAIATAVYVAKYGITAEQLVEFERYSKKVRGITAKTYKLHEAEINPLNLKRGQGPDDYHLDHIVPIHVGFIQGLEPEFIARKENLQMLKSFDNLSKGRK